MNSNSYRVLSLLCLFSCLTLTGGVRAPAQSRILQDIPYKTSPLTDYEEERCMLDLHVPEGAAGYATVVWFHGGSLEEGDKAGDIATGIARRLNAHGLALASVNYRLSPRASFPAYVHDAAAATAWVVKHIAEHDGDPRRVFVSGHSAGGYLTAMIGMDPRYLELHDLRPEALAGYIPIAGQMITHSTVRQERGIAGTTPVIDEAAPAYHARPDTAPFLNICADNDLPARVEENIYFLAALRAAGNERARLLQIRDRDHGSVAARIAEENDPALEAMLKFINDL